MVIVPKMPVHNAGWFLGSSWTGWFFWLVPPSWYPLWKYLNFLQPHFETDIFYGLYCSSLTNLIRFCVGGVPPGGVCKFMAWSGPSFFDLFLPKTIIYDIGTKILYETCFATKMLLLFCKSMIPVRFCTVFPLHSCAGIKTRFKALLKTQYLTLGPNF